MDVEDALLITQPYLTHRQLPMFHELMPKEPRGQELKEESGGQGRGRGSPDADGTPLLFDPTYSLYANVNS